MNLFLTIAPLIITFVGILYFATKKMKKDGVIYVLIFYFKWFFGIIVTMGAFYIVMLSGEYLKERDFSVVFSLPIGVLVWFIPMHYSSKIFYSLEKKYKKEGEMKFF